jgi:hypothetical protein
LAHPAITVSCFGWKVFFRALVAGQHQTFLSLKDHAELLDLCRVAAGRGEWDGKHFDPWRGAVPGLEKQIQEAESRANSLDFLSDALRLVIQIESSEVNRIYLGIVAASDSAFVRKLRVFHEAGLEHISYICERIPELDPELRDACQKLRDEYSRSLAQA